jgi:hypothetical protein
MKRITAKIGNMRKAQEFVVYPLSKGETTPTTVTIQSDTRIAVFETATGRGMLSKAKSSGAYFMHLSAALGATPFVAGPDLVLAALAAQPKSGDEIGPGVRIA